MTQATPQPTTAAPPPSIQEQQPSGFDKPPQPIVSCFTSESSLSQDGYTIVKRHKTMRFPEVSSPTEVSYAVLLQGGVTIATFDGIHHPLGNTADFGLYAFLGGRDKQLVVQQTIPRGWRHWIVNLRPTPRVIFDGAKWKVDRELRVVDVDGDGVHEITQAVPAYCHLFGSGAAGTTYSPIITFRYDQDLDQYVPGNRYFQQQILEGLQEEARRIDGLDREGHWEKVLYVTLGYIYAGRRNEGWAFYIRQPGWPNKQRLRVEVEEILKNEPVYRFLYRGGGI